MFTELPQVMHVKVSPNLLSEPADSLVQDCVEVLNDLGIQR